MKNQALALGLGAALSGFVGAAVAVLTLSDRGASPSDTVAAAGPASAVAAPKSDEERKLAARAAMLADSDAATLAELNRRIDILEGELASLRSERSRQAVGTQPDLAKLAATPEVVAEIQREAIVQVLEDQRKAEQERREQERKERARAAADELAARAAKELGLGAGDERRLAEFYVAAGDKRDELFRSVRDGAGFDRDTMRKNFDEYRTWSEGELNTAFGAGVGGRIIEFQRQQRDFGGWGGFGGGFGGGPPTGGAVPTGGDAGRARGGRGGQ